MLIPHLPEAALENNNASDMNTINALFLFLLILFPHCNTVRSELTARNCKELRAKDQKVY